MGPKRYCYFHFVNTGNTLRHSCLQHYFVSSSTERQFAESKIIRVRLHREFRRQFVLFRRTGTGGGVFRVNGLFFGTRLHNKPFLKILYV